MPPTPIQSCKSTCNLTQLAPIQKGSAGASDWNRKIASAHCTALLRWAETQRRKHRDTGRHHTDAATHTHAHLPVAVAGASLALLHHVALQLLYDVTVLYLLLQPSWLRCLHASTNQGQAHQPWISSHHTWLLPEVLVQVQYNTGGHSIPYTHSTHTINLAAAAKASKAKHTQHNNPPS